MMRERQYPPTALTVPRLVLDPYRCGVDVGAAPARTVEWSDEDWRVPPQTRTGQDDDAGAAAGSSRRLPPADRRRLELHAALTRVGVAPAPEDLHAMEALSALDDLTNAAVRRWIGPR
ncbi:hypothetical protein [Streptomyces sp. NPDC003247]|uniref:hypothetical protein n=1 Tax=Streptomyces sp. NPDC003247 TaxID=3364677 RepID=UPI0036A70079